MLRDTPVIPYTRPPVSTDRTTGDRPRDGNLIAICRIPPQSAVFRRNLPSLLSELPTGNFKDL